MIKYELSKLDFDLLDEAFKVTMLRAPERALRAQLEQLRDKFRGAHTGWLEIEE